jgi:hypothetical protein
MKEALRSAWSWVAKQERNLRWMIALWPVMSAAVCVSVFTHGAWMWAWRAVWWAALAAFIFFQGFFFRDHQRHRRAWRAQLAQVQHWQEEFGRAIVELGLVTATGDLEAYEVVHRRCTEAGQRLNLEMVRLRQIHVSRFGGQP